LAAVGNQVKKGEFVMAGRVVASAVGPSEAIFGELKEN